MLKRFVTYIYQYEGGRRGSNAGFVKADIRDAGCRIQIQLRTPDRLQGTCKAYLIVGGENPVGIFAGEIPLHQGTGQLRLAYPRSLLTADGHTVGQVQAVALRCSGGNHLLSCWTDQVPEAVLYGKFDIWGEHVQPTPENMPETAAADNSTAADTAGSDDATSTTTADASAATGTASTLTAPLDTADAPDAGSDAPEAVSDDAPAPEATSADTATPWKQPPPQRPRKQPPKHLPTPPLPTHSRLRLRPLPTKHRPTPPLPTTPTLPRHPPHPSASQTPRLRRRRSLSASV